MAYFHFSEKKGKKGRASEHSAYIAREGKYGRGEKAEDLVAKGCLNLPDWANGAPLVFWRAADTYERVNGTAYREIEVALPNELTVEQNLELVHELIQSEFPGRTVQFAIHAPASSLRAVQHTHAHIMGSDRVLDAIERPQEQHFRRFNSADPACGGCRKDSGGRSRTAMKEEMHASRAAWAEMQNAALLKYGHEAQVDHRSNEARGLQRVPERYLGQVRISKMSSQEKKLFIALQNDVQGRHGD